MATIDEATKAIPIAFVEGNGLTARFKSFYHTFHARREALGLRYPGTVENLAKEVQRDVFLTNSMFTGLRADITKVFSVNPVFHTSHGFSIGSQGLPPYTFVSTYGTDKVALHATVDNDGQLSGRGNYRWTNSWVTKTQAQIASGPGQSMIQIDNDYQGKDFSASIKSINPSILDGGLTGIFVGSYLQSVSPGLALGLEAVWQRPAMSSGPDSLVSYVAKYRGSDWVGSAQIQASGALQTSYWRRLMDKVEVGAELNLQLRPGMGGGLMGGGLQKEGLATIGAKYDFRMSSFRAQADSSGKLSILVEKRVLQPLQVIFAGELDQLKQTAKVGLAISLESSSDEIMQAQAEGGQQGPIPPF